MDMRTTIDCACQVKTNKLRAMYLVEPMNYRKSVLQTTITNVNHISMKKKQDNYLERIYLSVVMVT